MMIIFKFNNTLFLTLNVININFHVYLFMFMILQLDDGGGQFLVRPYAEAFIEEMADYYEVVIFTAAL